MNASNSSRSGSADALLADVVEEITNRFQAGERVDVEQYVRAHPELAEPLRRLLPALGVLADLGQSAASGEAVGVPLAPEPAVELGELGDFRIFREVGRGGMGVVYEAEQISLGRRVALKVLPFAAALDAKQLQRFKNEAQAAAHLQHQHIVPVYYVGCERGVHFYAMQLIDGHTLAAVIQDLRQLAGPERADLAHPAADPASPTVAALSTERSTSSPAFFRSVANLGLQAAEALEYAHQFGVIHRDIKPANLLVDAAGHLWVTDFGLARLGADAGLTMTGDLVGTLRYMSPEQALGQRVTIDARTDVYSLGVTLYELLTLEPVYNGRSREEVLRQIAFEEPRPLWRLNKAVPADLETIVLKAMAKAAEERYATAGELVDDLRRYLEDKPIQARRPTLRQRSARWARRHKTVVRAAFVVLVLAVVALAVSTVFIWRAKEDLEQSLERARQNAYYQRIALAEREWSANNLRRMQQLLADCPEHLRGWEWRYLERLRYKGLSVMRHDGAALGVAISRDGERIASCSQDGVVKVWDARTGQKLREFRAHENHARSVAFSPDGRRLATASWDGSVKTWDAQTGQELAVLRDHGDAVGSVAFSPDGQLLVAGDRSGAVTVWDLTTGNAVLHLTGQSASMHYVAFGPDGKRLAAGGADGTVAVWDAQTGQQQFTFRGHAHRVWGVAFSSDGKYLASGGGLNAKQTDGELKVWDVQTGREVFSLRGHTSAVCCVAFSPDGRRLASGSMDETVKLWDLQTGQEALTLHGHLDFVRGVAFSPDGHQLISASHDRTVRVWDARPVSAESVPDSLTLRGHDDAVNSVAFSPVDRRLLASGSADRTIKLWDVWNGKQLHTLRSHAGSVQSVAFSPDGQRLASASYDKTVMVWEATRWQEAPTLHLHTTGPLKSVTFSPDGRLLAAAGYDKVVTIWDALSGKKVHQLPDHGWVVQCVAFSRDGQRVASACSDGTVRLWDVTTGREIAGSPLQHSGLTMGVTFSPDGRRLASGGLDRSVRVWDATSRKQLLLARDPTGGVWSVVYSPRGRRLAWGSRDATVKVWDEASEEVHTLRGHTGWVQSVAFSSDGQQIASASTDGTIKLWDAPRVAGPPGSALANPDQ